MSSVEYEEIDKYEILDNNREIPKGTGADNVSMKPIDEVKIILNGIVKDMSTVKSDMAVIKNRLYELQNEVGLRQRENRLLKEEKCQSRSWFY
jgi:hypothetical protein